MQSPLRVCLSLLALFLCSVGGMCATYYTTLLLFRFTDPKTAAQGLPFLYVTAFGGLMLGFLTAAIFVFRTARLALFAGGILTSLFLLGFFFEGCSDSRWTFAFDRNAPLIAWSLSLLLYGGFFARIGFRRQMRNDENNTVIKHTKNSGSNLDRV